MRFGSVIFWGGFVMFLALSVVGYQHYYKSLRVRSKSLQKATNQIGDLKGDMERIRQQTDAAFGIQGGSGKPGGVNSGGVKKNANKQLKALENRRKTLRGNEEARRIILWPPTLGDYEFVGRKALFKSISE